MKQQKQPEIPTIDETIKQWDAMSDNYAKFDSTPQGFYFTLMNILDLSTAKHILEVGCGRCLLVPHALQLKPKECTYLATDVTEKMIELANKRLENNFNSYQSKLTYEEWLKVNNLEIKVHDGEEPFNFFQFDRIICNMVVMLTPDSRIMLKNLYDEAAEGCLLGVSVWGSKQLNQFHTQIENAVIANGVQPPSRRSNHYLYKKLSGVAESVGWRLISNWEQVNVFPYLSTNSMEDFINFTVSRMKCSEQKKQAICNTFRETMQKKLDAKMGITFPAELYVFRK